VAVTIGGMWERAAAREAGATAFLVPEGDGWRSVTWGEASERVDELAAGFLALGVRRGDPVAILSRTRIEWTLCDYALASIGAVVVPLYQTNSRDECAYLLSDSRARVLVCENTEQLRKTEGLARELPELEHLIAIDDAEGDVRALSEVAAGGADRAALAEARAAVTDSDVLTYIYTSGTTGPPKGCVLTHANFVAAVDSVAAIEDMFVPGDVVLLFLPLAHNFARLVQYATTALGHTVAFCTEFADVPAALASVRPTILPTVPRMFEKVHGTIQATFDEATGPKRRLIEWSVRAGRRAARRRAARERLPAGLALQYRIADRLVFEKIRTRLGGRIRYAISGGAPLAPEIIEFFAACGVLILEGYGLSESTSACATNQPRRYRFGTVGLPLPGVELRLADDGEILVRGRTVFRGYLGRDDATAEVLSPDGWLRTGDIGRVDEDGFVTITDRKKEIIVTAGGKKIAPQNLENALKTSPVVSQALVVGDRRPYIAALVSVDREEAAKLSTGEDEIRALVEKAVAEVNERLGRAEQIKRFAILSRDFSMEAGEVTPTLKLKRRVCEEHFRAEIDALYG
jgi:long-chain acyl-CoA synthetase